MILAVFVANMIAAIPNPWALISTSQTCQMFSGHVTICDQGSLAVSVSLDDGEEDACVHGIESYMRGHWRNLRWNSLVEVNRLYRHAMHQLR